MKPGFAGKLLSAIAARRNSLVTPLSSEWQHERQAIAETRRRTDLLLTDAAALHLVTCVRAARALPGAFAEAGVFKGGSARLICLEKQEKELHLFDVFETLQTGADADGQEVRAHFGSVHGTLVEVRQLLAPYGNLHFYAGLFPGTTQGLESLQFSFVHLDLDLVAGTQAALEYFYPRLVPGGILLGDDYCERYAKPAFNRWFADREDTLFELPWSQVMVIRR